LGASLFLEPLLSLKVISQIFGNLLTPYIVKNYLGLVLEFLDGSEPNQSGPRIFDPIKNGIIVP
jgi:hypothetical protein